MKMEKSDHQWMASTILTLILGRESIPGLIERLCALCGGRRKRPSMTKMFIKLAKATRELQKQQRKTAKELWQVR